MEVSCKNNSKTVSLVCNICKDDGKCIFASGCCQQCKEYMCTACFDKHKKQRISRSHMLLPVGEADTSIGLHEADDFKRCEQTAHLGDIIKFYCPTDKQVGCGECIILKHELCEYEYIRDKAKTFKESQEFKDWEKGVNEGMIQATQIATTIKNNKKQVRDINNKFVADVQTFSTCIISKIHELNDSVIKQAEFLELKDIVNLDNLEKENEAFMKEMSALTAPFEEEIDKPNKLFASYVQQEAKLKHIQETYEGIMKKNSIQNYQFKPDGFLMHTKTECKELGTLQVVTQKTGDKDIPERDAFKASYQRGQVEAASHTEIRFVYILDPKNTESTTTFAKKFRDFVGPRIESTIVKSCSECTEDYRIALLCIRLTDRPSEDIESILENLNKDFYKRTVLIYIHVRHNKKSLPGMATKIITSEFHNTLGDILDFGLIDGNIEACVYDGVINSEKAFKNFVMAGKVSFTPTRGYYSLP